MNERNNVKSVSNNVKKKMSMKWQWNNGVVMKMKWRKWNNEEVMNNEK